MARFYVSGRYGNSSRSHGFTAGGRNSVDSTHTRGWRAGVEVECFAMTDDKGRPYDRFDIYMTPGSAGAGHRVLVGQVIEYTDSKGRKSPKWRPAGGRKNTKG